MVAADWYGVQPETEISDRVLRLTPILDSLDEADAELMKRLIHRLTNDQR
jgi:hypothetical protein